MTVDFALLNFDQLAEIYIYHIYPIHVVTFTLISNLATDYIQSNDTLPQK